MTDAIPLGKLLAEGTAIVVSILLALAADAWFEERSNIAEERGELVRLHQELSASLSAFERDVAAQENLLEHSESLLTLLESTPNTGSSIPVPDSLTLSLLFAPTWEWESAALSALLSSGRMRLIRDREIREGIAGWTATREQARENQDRARSFYMERVLPYLTDTAGIVGLIGHRRIDVEELVRRGAYPWELPRTSTILPHTVELRNLAAQKILFSGEALRASESAVAVLSTLVALLEQAGS